MIPQFMEIEVKQIVSHTRLKYFRKVNSKIGNSASALSNSTTCKIGMQKETTNKGHSAKINLTGLIFNEESNNVWLSIVFIIKATSLAKIDSSMQVCRTNNIPPDSRSI